MIFVFWLMIAGSWAGGSKTPVRFDDFRPLDFSEVEVREWRAPNYEGQEGRLGYHSTAFAVPVGLEDKVSFWIDIYSKYNSHQGVIHDADHAEIVHEFLDFTDIESNAVLTSRQKERARRKRVDAAKSRVKARLRSLRGVRTAKGLTGDRLKTFLAYQKVREPDKFRRATHKLRLRFQLGQKDRFQQAMYYSGRYIEQMEKIFVAQGLPIELVRMVYVESSFNIYAISKAGASGLFQIMPRTGRQYFRVGRSVDYRNHPFRAAEAAAKILKQNYRMLQSWPLAVTGYNHGAYGLRKLVKRYGTNNIAELVDSDKTGRRFGFASRNFYATFLAALHVEKSAKETFGKVRWAPVLQSREIQNPVMISWKSLVKWFGGDSDLARMHNPHITYRARKGYRLIPRNSYFFVPNDKVDVVIQEMKSLRVAGKKFQKYKVRPGDTLGGIAGRFGTTVTRLMDINAIQSAHRIRVGQWLQVPQ